MVGSTPTRFRHFLRSALFCDHTLAKKKSKKKYSVGKEARRRARERTGLPPAERVIPDKRRKPPKHKKQVFEQELC